MIAASLLLFALALPQAASPQEKDKETHDQLRALRDGMLEAIKKGDIERQLSFLHPNVVVTWENAEVSRGRDGVRKYLDRILGPGKFVAGYSVDLNVDELTILYGGDTGVSFGSAVEHFKLTGGGDFTNPARWSSTLVKEGDRWLIASFHASSNLFDNPMLAMERKITWIAGAACLLGGLLIGFLVGRRRRAA
jgi:ketosteroid isomerase-like protein